MTTEDTTALLLPDAPLWLLLSATVLLLVLRVRCQAWGLGLPPRRQPLAWLGRAGIGGLALAAAALALQRVVTLATSWNLWLIIMGGALTIEGLLALYRLERRAVPRRLGLALTLLRVALALALLIVLCQPVLVLNTVREFRRQVVVLLDESDSMRVPDNNLTAGEKVRLAEGLALPAARRVIPLEREAATLRQARDQLQAQADWFSALGAGDPELTGRQLHKNRAALQDALRAVLAATTAATNALAGAANQPFMTNQPAVTTQLAGFAKTLTTGAQTPLDALIARASHWRRASTNGVAESQAALADLQAAGKVLAELHTPLMETGEILDGAFYQAASAADRATFDRVAAMPRLALARALLLGAPPQPAASNAAPAEADDRSPGLLDRLDREYGVRLYRIGAAPVGVAVADFLKESPDASATDDADAQRRSTDLAGSLEKVAATLKPEETAGILLLTDGRHNAASPVEPIARNLGLEPVPVYPVIFGGNRAPPTDAAIVSVTAPETVSTNDHVLFNVELKADGLAGTNIALRLFDDGRLVASNAFTAVGGTFRTRLQLSDRPMTNALHDYRLELMPQPGDVNASNNVCHVPVLVASDPVKVLLVDGLPRWEFRYLKNLFLERDQNVKFQHMLFRPDLIDGVTNRPVIAASVARPDDELEATALPADESEWMKFDVILLGDVSPADLGVENLGILNRYVLNRGGTLIVLAGPMHMPHAFAGTPLEAVLPVTFTPSAQPILAAPESAFRIVLTALGRDTAFMKLADDGARNLAAWQAVPDLYWRHGLIAAKEGASVLAYALPTAEAQRAGQAGYVPGVDALQQQQARERNRALIVSQHAGYGNVLFLGTDQSWRLRYREGDTRHHKFWGQVMRWATSDRIGGGTELLRLGTDRTRYNRDEPVRIRARVSAPDFSPVLKASLRVSVWNGDRHILRRALAYVEESPGVYSAEIGSLPAGRYRVELDPKDARGLPEALRESVTTAFAVTDAIDAEQVELAADRGLLSRVASLSTGALLDPLELAAVAERLGPATVRNEERRQIDLWNSWMWWALIVALFTAEWLLRKKARLP